MLAPTGAPAAAGGGDHTTTQTIYDAAKAAKRADARTQAVDANRWDASGRQWSLRVCSMPWQRLGNCLGQQGNVALELAIQDEIPVRQTAIAGSSHGHWGSVGTSCACTAHAHAKHSLKDAMVPPCSVNVVKCDLGYTERRRYFTSQA